MTPHSPHPTVLQTIGIHSTIALILSCLLLFSGCISNTPKESTTKENFLHDSEAKMTVRELANPIADVESFDTIVSSVIDENPFGCTAYMTDGQRHAPVEKVKEFYTLRLVYEDDNANVIGSSLNDFNTVSGFNSGIVVLMGNWSLAKAHGGTCIHDPEEDTYYAALRCHDANGELFYLTFRRDEVVLGAYSDDAIRARFEAWADKIPPLAQAGTETSYSLTPLRTDFAVPQIS